MCIRPTKSVHPTYKTVHPTDKMCSPDLLNLCNRPTKVVHPTYKKCESALQKYVHPTYIKLCATGTSILMIALSTTY